MSLPRRCEDRSCQRPPYVRGQHPCVLTFCTFLSLSVSHVLMCAVFFYGRTWVAWKRQDHPFGWSVLCHGFSLLTACLRPSFLAGLWRWVRQLSRWPPGPQWECSVGALWPLLRCPPTPPSSTVRTVPRGLFSGFSGLHNPAGEGHFSCHCDSGKCF